MPTFSQNYQNLQNPGQPATTTAAEPPAPTSPFQYGPLVLHTNFSYQFTYETGLQAAPGEPTDTTQQTYTPEISAQDGSIWNLTYVPTWEKYSSPLFKSSFAQSANLGANFSPGDWSVALAQSFSQSADPLIETGTQVRQQDYGTNLDFHFGNSSSSPSLETTLQQSIRFASGLPTVYDWSTQDWIHVPASQQMDFAAGAGCGYTHQDPGFDMAYARPEVRFNWKPTATFYVDAEAGVQETKLLAAARSQDGSKIFNANATYQPWSATTLAAEANRQVSSSFESNEVTESTTFDVQWRQRLLSHFFLSVQASSSTTDYLSTSSDLANVRGDRPESIEASLTTVVFRRINFQVSASRTHNTSTVQGFGFTTGQYSFQASLGF